MRAGSKLLKYCILTREMVKSSTIPCHSLANSVPSGSSQSIRRVQTFWISILAWIVTGLVMPIGSNSFEDSCSSSLLVRNGLLVIVSFLGVSIISSRSAEGYCSCLVQYSLGA